MRKVVSRIDGNIFLIVALSLFAWAPLLGPAYFLKAHDAPHSIFFLLQFDQAIRDGALWPRWGTDFALGYGYPLFNFYAPLVYYIAEVFHLLGASLTAAVKMTYILAFILSGLAMYLFVKEVFDAQAGLVAAVVYVYVPYHLLDIYVRSALAEFFAFVFFPLVLWSFYQLLETQRLRYIALAGATYAGLVLTHNAAALSFTPLLMAYIAFLVVTRAGLTWRLTSLSLAALLLALGLSAIFWLPMFAELKYIVVEQWKSASYSYDRHFVYPSQLLSPFWGYGYAGPGLSDEISFQLGLVPTVLALVASLAVMRGRVRRKELTLFFLAATIVIVLAMLPFSLPLWRFLPIADLVQFPWRMLALTTLTLSFLAGAALTSASPSSRSSSRSLRGSGRGSVEPSNEVSSVVGILLILVALASYSYTLPQYTDPSPRSEEPVAVIDFETFHPPDRVGMTAWVTKQPQTSPLVRQYLAGQPLVKAKALTEGATVEMIRHGGASEEIRVQSARGAKVQFYTYYFPGWRGYIDGQETEIYPSGSLGLITVEVPAGEHEVAIRFGDTPVRVVGKIISLASLLVALFVLMIS